MAGIILLIFSEGNTKLNSTGPKSRLLDPSPGLFYGISLVLGLSSSR